MRRFLALVAALLVTGGLFVTQISDSPAKTVDVGAHDYHNKQGTLQENAHDYH